MVEMTSPTSPSATHKWTIFVDEVSSSTGSREDIILKNDEGVLIKVSLMLSFSTSNHQAEYETSLARLRLAEDLGAEEVKIFTYS